LLFAVPGVSQDSGDVPAEAPEAVKPTPGTRLQGTASLGRNREVVGATVVVRDETDPSRLFMTATDGKGHFRVGELPNGTYSVQVLREGLAPVFKEGIELRFPFRAVVEVPMREITTEETLRFLDPEAGPAPGGAMQSVHGEAKDRQGREIGQVMVRLVSHGGDADPFQVATNPDGMFDVGELSAGRWRIRATSAGFLPLRALLDLSGETDVQLRMVRQPASYSPSPFDLMPEEEAIPPAGFP
jgi:hypothetical protein